MGTTLVLESKEIREIFDLIKMDLDYRFYTHREVKPWPLYDKIADYLGENSSSQHIEAIRLRWEEEKEDFERDHKEDEDLW